MDSNSRLTAQQRAELALFLINEGEKIQRYGRTHAAQAACRYAQSLSVFASLLMPNLTWISYALLNLGKIHQISDRPAQAAAFLRASGYLQRAIPPTPEGDASLKEISHLLMMMDAVDPEKEETLDFEIQVFAKSQRRFRVTPLGDLQWGPVIQQDQPAVLGVEGWDVIVLSARGFE